MVHTWGTFTHSIGIEWFQWLWKQTECFTHIISERTIILYMKLKNLKLNIHIRINALTKTTLLDMVLDEYLCIATRFYSGYSCSDKKSLWVINEK